MYSVYAVEWTDHEGNLNQRLFDNLDDALLEAKSLLEHFDYVSVEKRGREKRVSHKAKSH